MKPGPMAFMRGLTFPGGQHPVIRGKDVYLRYPRVADFKGWARLRGESREFLTPWEPSWAGDELTKGAFRRRIKRYQKENRHDSAYAFFVFRSADNTLKLWDLNTGKELRTFTGHGERSWKLVEELAKRG